MKKILSLLTVSILASSSITNSVAFINKNKKQINIKTKNVNNKKFISDEMTNFHYKSDLTDLTDINIVKEINNKIYVGISNGSLFVSSDKGMNFTRVDSITPYGTYINTIQQINNKIYVGTAGGLYVSSDKTEIKFVPVNGNLSTIWINNIQQINNKIYVGTFGGLYVSSDGVNFSKLNSIPNDGSVNTIDEINNGIYVGTDDGLYVSSDDGVNFSKLNQSGISDYYQIYKIQQINNKIYVGTAGGLYVSSDGKSFTKATDIPSDANVNTIEEINSIIYIGTFNSDGSKTYGLYISSDGKSFTQVSSIPRNGVINKIEEINHRIYVGTDNGLYASSDGKSFTKATDIPSDANVNTIEKINNGIYAGTDNGLYVSDTVLVSIDNAIQDNNIYELSNTTSINLLNKSFWWNGYAVDQTGKKGCFRNDSNSLNFDWFKNQKKLAGNSFQIVIEDNNQSYTTFWVIFKNGVISQDDFKGGINALTFQDNTTKNGDAEEYSLDIYMNKYVANELKGYIHSGNEYDDVAVLKLINPIFLKMKNKWNNEFYKEKDLEKLINSFRPLQNGNISLYSFLSDDEEGILNYDGSSLTIHNNLSNNIKFKNNYDDLKETGNGVFFHFVISLQESNHLICSNWTDNSGNIKYDDYYSHIVLKQEVF